MNKNEQAQAISVMQAQMDGKAVECILRVHMKNDTGNGRRRQTRFGIGKNTPIV